jgi:hypothetical protein
MSPFRLEEAFRAISIWAREVGQAGKGILKIVGLVVLAGFTLVIVVTLYNSYESHQPVDHDTPVWIQGDWLVGEYRVCQMRTKTVPPQKKELDSLDKLPRLFCGADSNGLFDFQRETALVSPSSDTQAPPQGSMYLFTVTADAFDSYFHILPVRYFGSIQPSPDKDFIYDYDRTDKWVISWRCQRNSNSLTCKALD